MSDTETKPVLKIESLDDMKRVLTIARGGDPDAIQAVTNFMDFKSDIERSYFPDKTTTLCVGQLEGFAKLYYPNADWDPFSLTSGVIAIAFMPYKGFKSNQFVDMTRTQPDLSGLKTSTDEQKQSTIDRILRRGPTE